MVCVNCRREISDGANYCESCGSPQKRDPGPPPNVRRLTRAIADRKIAGVCGGLAAYFGVDSTLIRLLWLVLSIVPGAIVGGVLMYLVAWLIIPNAPVTAFTPVSHT